MSNIFLGLLLLVILGQTASFIGQAIGKVLHFVFVQSWAGVGRKAHFKNMERFELIKERQLNEELKRQARNLEVLGSRQRIVTQRVPDGLETKVEPAAQVQPRVSIGKEYETPAYLRMQQESDATTQKPARKPHRQTRRNAA